MNPQNLSVGVTVGREELISWEPRLFGNEFMWIEPNSDGMPPSWQDQRFTYCRTHGTKPLIGMRLDGDTTRYAAVIEHLTNVPSWLPEVYITEHANPEADYQGNHTQFIQNYRDWYVNVCLELPEHIWAKTYAGPVLSREWTEANGGNYSRFDPGLAYSDFYAMTMLVDPGEGAPANLAKNPSFNDSDISLYGALLGNSAFTRVTGATDGQNGSAYGRITWSAAQTGAPDGGMVFPYATLPYQGTSLDVGVWVRSSRAQVIRLQGWCYDAQGNYLADAGGAVELQVGANSWTYISGRLTSTLGAVQIRPSVRASWLAGALWQTGDTLDVDNISIQAVRGEAVATSYPNGATYVSGFRDYRISAADTRFRVIAQLGAIGLPNDPDGTNRANFYWEVFDEIDTWSFSAQGWDMDAVSVLSTRGKPGRDLLGLGPDRYYSLDVVQTALNLRDDYNGDPVPWPLWTVNDIVIAHSDDPTDTQPSQPATPPAPRVPPTIIELPPGGLPTSGPAAAKLLQADYTILITDKNLQVLGDPIYEWKTLQATIKWKEPGSGAITVPAFQYVRQQLVPGARVVVIRRLLGTQHIMIAGPVESWQRERSDNGENGGVGMLTINFTDDMSWLAVRLAFPDPSKPIDQQTTDFWNFSGDPEQAMLQLVNTQAGPGALTQRRIPKLVVAPYSGVAGTGTVGLGDTSDVNPRERLETLTDVLRNICTLGANPPGSTPYHPDSLGFRVRQTRVNGADVILFEPVRSRDLTGELHFSFGRGNLQYYSFEQDAPTATTLMVGGQGETSAEKFLRELGTTDPEVLAWGRYEEYLAQDGTQTLADAQAAVDKELADKIVSSRVAVNASDTVDQRWGIHYDVGDIGSVELDADEFFQGPVQTVNVQAWPTAGEVVGVTIGDQSARFDSAWSKQMRDLERRLGRQERRP